MSTSLREVGSSSTNESQTNHQRNTKQYMEKDLTYDPLWLDRFLSLDLFKFKTVRMVLMANLIIHSSKYCVQIYYFVQNPAYFIRFGAMFFGEPYLLAAASAILLYAKTMDDLWKGFGRWVIDSSSEADPLHQRINASIRRHTILIVTILLLGLCMGVACLFPSRYDRQMFFPIFLMENRWPDYARPLAVLYKLLMGPLAFCGLVHPVMIMYGTEHSIYQYKMLLAHLENVFVDYEERDEELLYYDGEYQEAVYERLTFFVARQTEIISFGLKINTKVIKPLFPLLAGFGYSVGFGLVMFIYAIKLGYYEVNIGSMILPILLISIVILLYGALIEKSQQFEDTPEYLFNGLQDLKWYNLNKRNNMTLLLMKTINNSNRKIAQIRFSELQAINYDLGTRMLRGIYSLASVVASINA